MNRRMPPCATCGHGWPLHIIPGGVENIDIYPHERHCVDCACRNYVEGPDTQKPWWCVTCFSWRHTAPCGRDNCPHPDDNPPQSHDHPPLYPDERGDWAAANRGARLARMAKKRGYSDEFPTTGKTSRYMLDYIPAPLWRAVRARAKRDGVSIRTLLLRLLTDWLESPNAR